MRSAVHVLLATFVAKIAECSWFPLNFNDFQCFDQRIFDETKGEKARYNVSDPRITAAVEETLRESGFFWGHSVPRTAANLQNRLVNDSAPPKTGWKGLGSASDALIIEVNNWDTHILSSWVATILLKEKVGYNVAHFQSGGAGGTFKRMSSQTSTPVHANVEVWPGGKAVQIKQWAAEAHSAGILGGFGRSGLYTTQKFTNKTAVEKQHFLEWWRSLEVPAVVKELSYLSPIQNASFMNRKKNNCWAKGGPEECTTCKNDTEMQCVNGTFVSPACAAVGGPLNNNGKCGVITMMDPAYDPGVVQQIVKNLKLSFNLAFVGYSQSEAHVVEREKNDEAVLFYHWQPDLFHVQHAGKFVRVTLPESTSECEQKGDGTPNGGINCDFPMQPMSKFTPVNLEQIAGSAAKQFFGSFTLTEKQQNELLRAYLHVKSTSDGTNHFQAACNWLKDNEAVWQDWIPGYVAPPVVDGDDSWKDNVVFITLYAIIVVAISAYYVIRGRKMGLCKSKDSSQVTPIKEIDEETGDLFEKQEELKRQHEEEQERAAHGTALLHAATACCFGSFIIGIVYLTVLPETAGATQRIFAGGIPIVGACMLLPTAISGSRGNSKQGLKLLHTVFPIVMIVEPLTLHFVLGGFQGSSCIFVWSLVAPVLAAQRGRIFAERLFLFVLCVLLVAGIMEYLDLMADMVVPRKASAWMFVINLGGAMSVAVASIVKFAKVLKAQKDDILERKRLEKTRRTFLASFSHELRTPLSGILGMLELLSEQKLPSIARHYVHKAIISSNLLLNLVNDILDMSRIEAGQMKMRNQPYNIRRAVKAVVDLVSSQAKVKRIKLARFVSDGVPTLVQGDVVRFRQIVLNLLSNAIKFTPQGTVTVRVDVVPSVVLNDCQVVSAGTDSAHKVMAEDGAVNLKVQVEDTGVGIQEGVLDRLFQMFSKISDDRVQNVLGCGIGLSICRHLVELMGGQIGVRTVYGVGSVFRFTMVCNPVNEEDATRSPTAEGPKRKIDSTKLLQDAKVLLAEDNAFNAEVLKTFLEHANCRVTHASNGRDVVANFISKQTEGGFDVVLMDCQMPIMDGYEATHQIRQWEKQHEVRRTPIVALTAYAMQGDRQRCIRSGMDSVTTKPVTKPVLLREVARAIAGTQKHSPDAEDEAGNHPEEETSSGGRSDMSRWIVQANIEGSTSENTASSFHSGSADLQDHQSCSTSDSSIKSGHTTSSSDDRITTFSPGATPHNAARRLSKEVARSNSKPGAIDIQLGLTQFGGSRQMYAQMLTHFATHVLPQGMINLRTAHERADLSALRAEAHSLNGAAGFVGASMLSDLCMRLTDACNSHGDRSYNQDVLQNHLAQIGSEFSILEEWFKDKHSFHVEVENTIANIGSISAYNACRAACSTRRVLVAEDDEFTRSALQTVLADAGMSVTVCTDGEAAVRLTKEAVEDAKQAFDIIILDSCMPKLNGAGACKEIRTWEAETGTQRTPILGFSATVEGEGDCKAAGMDAFVTKIQRTPLLQTIMHSLGLGLPDVDAELPVFKPAKTVAISPIDNEVGIQNFSTQTDFDSALESFCDGQLVKSASAIAKAVKTQNITALHKEAHALKTAAGFMGAMALSRTCGELQVKCSVDGVVRDGDHAGLKVLIAKLNTELKNLSDFMMAKTASKKQDNEDDTTALTPAPAPAPAVLPAPTTVNTGLPPLPTAPTVADPQAVLDAKFEEWIVQNRMSSIRDKLHDLGVMDKSDLAELDLCELRDLRQGLKKVALRKLDKDLQSVGISLDALNASPSS